MHSLGHYIGVPKQMEILFLTLIGICCTAFDASLLDLHMNLRKVWQIGLSPGDSQTYLKYLLSGIILVRTFSVHLYLAFYIVMLWPAIFEERPALLLPWLIVGAIKSLLMGVMSLFIGMYTCISYGIYKSTCIDFLFAQIVDHLPSWYVWFCVASYYLDLKSVHPSISSDLQCIDFESEVTMRRRKVRSMADNITVKHHSPIDEDRHLISVSTIENVVQQLTTDLHKKATRSLDSLLSVMAAEAEKEELMNLCDDVPAEETGLSIPERTAKLLKLSEADIAEAINRKKKNSGHNTVFTTSMLEIKDIGERQPNVFKVRDRFASLRTDTLRPTRSEKGVLGITDYSWHNTTDFMTDISEVEIGPILNYSSAALSTPKVEMKFLNKKPLIEKKILEPLRTVYLLPKFKNDIQVHGKFTGNQKQKPPEVKKKFDFGCQASTLSRNFLKYPKVYLNFHSKTKSHKTSGRSLPRNEPVLKEELSGIEENLEQASPMKIKRMNSGEFSKNSIFKADGYVMAYNKEKMRKKAKAKDPEK